MTSQNGLKIFILVHLHLLTLNPKNYQIILFLSRDTVVTMSKFVTKGKFI